MNKEPKFDLTGFSESDKKQLLAQGIETYVLDYQPSNWIEPVRKCSGCPEINAEQASYFLEQFKNGKLATILDNFENGKYKTWFIKEAIIEFFEKGRYKNYL